MENAIAAGLSKQLILQRALEITANNVANQSTAGFKAERIAFREFIARIDAGLTETGQATTDPFVSLAFDPESYTDFSAGSLTATYGELDFAIDGPGFFAVETDAGVRYTRDGRFAVNAFGELVAQNGARILDAGGAPILIDVNRGPLAVTPEGDLQQAGLSVGAIGVFDFAVTRGLTRIGDNLFVAAEPPALTDRPRLRQGFLEAANAEPIRAMTDMVEILRAYEQTARLLETANELSRTAVERLSEAA